MLEGRESVGGLQCLAELSAEESFTFHFAICPHCTRSIAMTDDSFLPYAGVPCVEQLSPVGMGKEAV